MFTWSLSYNSDNIKLGKRIGHGAQAEIFKAKYGRTGVDEVVVKRFLNSRDKSTKREVAIIQQLTHKNIVQFYHVHHDMIVMEYVEGGNLAEAIVGKALRTWEFKTQIAKDISLGLAYLHSVGIIHCDIKSSNILLTEHKEAKICDFGLAMRVGESGGGGGTLQWMAPELLQTPPQYTSKSDVYALGMVMWEMASGSTQPYREHTPDGMMYCIVHGILEECPKNTPKAYADCIQMCWMLDADKRPCAKDVLPDVVQVSSGQDAPEQQKSIANKSSMDYYPEALGKHGPDGLMMMIKIGDSFRDTKTMDWFDSSAGGSGPAKAMLKMGTMYYSGGGGVQVDYSEALEWYLAASEAGIAVAMLKISQMYEYGHGVEQDDKEAIYWYCKGEDAVNERGRLNNRIVHHDAGVSEHHTRTMKWFINCTGGEAGNTSLQIGNMYHIGNDLVQDHSKAMAWYLKASDAGDLDAMYIIGVMYDQGQGADQDYSKAMEWLLKASAAGSPTAMRYIGVMYRRNGVEQDCSKAMEWYLKASDAGDATAKFFIGTMYYKGEGVKQDPTMAMEWLLKASDSGDASAMCLIGMMYEGGQGIEQDYSKVMEWYLKANDAGNTHVKRFIGALYERGQGVEQDYGKAMEWYLKASDSGDASAMCLIGLMHENGQGVEEDYGKAMEWYLEASNAGYAMAMGCIGDMYRLGLVDEQDDQHDDKAMEWLLKAVDGGDVVAMVSLGDMYHDGYDVERDYSKAMDWYLKASIRGDASAMCSIGNLYRDGKGVPQNISCAVEWYTKARDAGDHEAGDRLQEMLGSMLEGL